MALADGWSAEDVAVISQVEPNTGRKRLNINGVINLDSPEPVVRFGEIIDVEWTIALFKQLEQPRKQPYTTTITRRSTNSGLLVNSSLQTRASINASYAHCHSAILKYLQPIGEEKTGQ